MQLLRLNTQVMVPRMLTNIPLFQTHHDLCAGFKFWISESEDHYKPELAQLLYPLFTHLYIR